MNATVKSEERRRFFRIDDDIALYYKLIEATELKAASHVSQNVLEGCSLSTAWHILTQEAKIIQPRIETKDLEYAEYFKILNAKLDLIAQAFIMKDVDENEQKTRNVNLSASGLAFDNHEALPLGQHLKVTLILGAVVASIALQATVVYCRKNEDANKPPYLIGLDYENIQEQDRELLIQYIMQRQKQQIRESKEAAMQKLLA